MPFGATLDLTALGGAQRYAAPVAGYSLAAAGDVNGDGIGDLLIASETEAYVLFGAADTAGFGMAGAMRLYGFPASLGTAHFAGGAGDVNGDGFDDVIIGVSAWYNGNVESYVVFGGPTAPQSVVDVTTLDGSNGFRLARTSSIGGSVATAGSAGDLNNDGVDDFYVGLPYEGGGGTLYVLFGRDTAVQGDFQALIQLTAVDGETGFAVTGTINGEVGRAAFGGFDFNGDGVSDLVLSGDDGFGGMGAGPFFLYGRDTATTAGFDPAYHLTDLTGADGRITGWRASLDHLESAGDVNGDGLEDLVFNSLNIGGVILNPGPAGWASLGLAPWAYRFSIVGVGRNITSSAAAGDINGDGFDDVVFGVERNDGQGVAYVVYGRNTAIDPYPTELAPGMMDGELGFAITGFGRTGFSVAGVGDVNGDGVDDLALGAPGGYGYGESYVLFGRVDRTATAAGGVLNGAGSDDRLTGGVGNDVLNGLTGDDELHGGDKGDVLNGADGADQLSGDAGGDVLNGDAGDDDLFGGADGDKLFGADGADALSGGTGNDRLDGGDGVDALEGNEGNDLLDGGLGADALTGGAGNDVFLVDDAGDTTVELAGEGFDIVRTALDGWMLADNVEGLELQGTADLDGQGSGGANNLQGNAGANRLSGLAGVDTINGNDGDDVIVGGAGNDLLRGGIGLDRFVVGQDSIGATLETDQVYDFSAAEGDWIDLSGIDAIAGGGDDAFTLVGAFSKAAGQMTLTFAGGITTLKVDVNGDGKVDYQMKINGDVTGESGDWLL